MPVPCCPSLPPFWSVVAEGDGQKRGRNPAAVSAPAARSPLPRPPRGPHGRSLSLVRALLAGGGGCLKSFRSQEGFETRARLFSAVL